MDHYSDLLDYDKVLLAVTFFFISILMHAFCNCPLDNKTTGITVLFLFFIWYTFTFKWKSNTPTRFKSNKRRISNFPNYTIKENIMHANDIFNRPDHMRNVFILFVYSNCSCECYDQNRKCYSYSLQDTLYLFI